MRNKTIRPIVLVLSLLLLAATTVTPAPQTTSENQKVTHVLNRLGFGPRPGDVVRVQEMGIQAYIEQQLRPDRIDDSRVDRLVWDLGSLQTGLVGMMDQAPDAPRPRTPQAALANAKGVRQEAQNTLPQLISNRIVRGVHSERQLQEVMTDFWFNHFNVDWDKGAVRMLAPDYETKVIRPRVFGKFENLLLATAQSPAMLFYLDNHLSSAPAPVQDQRKRPANNNRRAPGINENYARELMELHTLGVDGGYTQKDVTEVARAFTGWTIDQPRLGGSFIFRPEIHDRSDKNVLGYRIRAGGMEEGVQVVQLLARHPSTAKFIATKLVRRFVSDEPPPALVERVAATYRKTDGDIAETLRTIFYSEEFMSPENFGKKLKSPLEYTVSSIRA